MTAAECAVAMVVAVVIWECLRWYWREDWFCLRSIWEDWRSNRDYDRKQRAEARQRAEWAKANEQHKGAAKAPTP